MAANVRSLPFQYCLILSRRASSSRSDVPLSQRNSTLLQADGRGGLEGVPIPRRNHLVEWIEKGVRYVSRPTIWSRAYYSPLIQSHEPWLNKSASFPRESPPLHLSFFPFHGLSHPLPPIPNLSHHYTCRMRSIQFEVASEGRSSSWRYIKDLRGS